MHTEKNKTRRQEKTTKQGGVYVCTLTHTNIRK